MRKSPNVTVILSILNLDFSEPNGLKSSIKTSTDNFFLRT